MREIIDGEQNQTKSDRLSKKIDFDILDQQIIRLLLSKPAITDSEIAAEIGISRQTVNRRRNSTSLREHLVEVLSISEKRIRRLTSLSLDTLEALLNETDPRLRLASAAAILKIGSGLMTATPDAFSFSIGEDCRTREWVKDTT